MYCHNCGKKLDDNTEKCPDCGTILKKPEPGPSSGPKNPKSEPSGPKSEPSSRRPAFLFLAILIVAAILAVIAVKTLFFGSRVLNPTDYVQLVVEGFDGEGTASLTFDYDRLLADIGEKKDLTQREIEEIRGLIPDAHKDFSLSRNSGLSNGDKITVESGFEKNVLKKYRVVFENGSIQYTVEGLTEILNIRVNDYLTLSFYGFEGHGYGSISTNWDSLYSDIRERILEVDSSDDAQNYVSTELYSRLYSIYAEPGYFEELSTGDEVKAVVNADIPELEDYGIRLEAEDITGAADGLAKTETLALENYVICSVEGYDGAGSAYTSLDTEKLLKDLEELFEKDERESYGPRKTSDADSETAEEAGEPETADPEAGMEGSVAEDAADEVYYSWRSDFATELSQYEELSNGDVVTLSCSSETDPVYLRSVGIYLEGFTRDVPVEGLTEPQDLDLTEAVSVSFEGNCPDVYIDFEIDYEKPYYWDTSLNELRDQSVKAYNGDQFSWNIEYDEQALLEMGYRVTNNQLECQISGLNTYDFAFDSLESEGLQPILEKAGVLAAEVIAKRQEDILKSANDGKGWIQWDRSGISLEYAKKAYVEEDYYYYNELFLLYHGVLPVTGWNRTSADKDVYVLICCYDVQESPDGSLVYEDRDYWLYMNESEAAEQMAAEEEYLGDTEIRYTELSGETPVTLPEAEETDSTGEEAEKSADSADAAALTAAPVLSGEAASGAAAVISYEGHTYARFEETMTWKEAQEFCEKAGGHLATVTSYRESAVIRQLLENGAWGEYWLGATDEAWEGKWNWVTGEDFAWTDWNSGQPDNYSGNDEGEENYLTVGSSFSYQWNDRNLSGESCGFVLELDPEREPDGMDLIDLIPVDESNTDIQGVFQDPYGNRHFGSLFLDASENAWITYSLGGQWAQLSGNVSTWTEAGSGASFDFVIWGDEKPLLTCYDYTKTEEPMSFSLDLRGVQTLTIQTCNRGEWSNGFLFLNETKIVPDPDAQVLSERKNTLQELATVDANNYEYCTGLWTDGYGKLHNGVAKFCMGQEASVLWNLNGVYTEFTGTFLVSSGSCSEASSVSIQVLADDEVVYETEGFTKYQGSLAFQADLTGKKKLEIRTARKEEGNDLYVYLTDAVLVRPAEEESLEDDKALEPIVFPEMKGPAVKQAAEMVTYGNYQYYRFDQEMTWQQANAFCKAAGGTLACITDPQKQAAVQYLVSSGSYQEYWLGGSRTGELWSWVDGSEFETYTNWSSGQPDNYNETENLLSMYRDGTWNDRDPETKTGFVMEVAALSGQQAVGDAFLSSLEWAESSNTDVVHFLDRQENLHLNSVCLDASNDAWFSCPLDGNYASMEGSVSITRKAADGVKLQLAMFGDGKLLYELRDYTKDRDSAEFSIDLTGVKVLTIASRNDGKSDYGQLFLNDAKLFLAEEKAEDLLLRLADLVSVDSMETTTDRELFRDAYGELREGYLAFKTGSEAYAMYNLNGRISTFCGTFTTSANASRDARMNIRIYADGELVFETEGYRKEDGPLAFEVDLTGKQTLEIRTEETTGAENTWLCLEEDQLR